MTKSISILFLCVTTSAIMWGKPAWRGPIERTLDNGEKVITYLQGDEHFHWMTDSEGKWLQWKSDNTVCATRALTEDEINHSRMKAPRQMRSQTLKATPINPAPRGLVILVNFADKTFSTNRQEIVDMLTSNNYTRSYSYKYSGTTYSITSKGSAAQYFRDASYGQYNPIFDVKGPVTVSQKMSYYGENDTLGNDKHPEIMIKEACKLVDDSVDFTLYDNNKDNKVDFVYVIYAGFSEADGGSKDCIWPHSWDLSSSTKVTVDGLRVGTYSCSSELSFYSKQHDGIATFCHEFGHAIGLPDVYSTNSNATFKTSGEWDIMDYGCYNNDGNTPPTYTGYERFMMGWATPRLLVDAEQVTLHELANSNEVLLISESDQHNLIGNDPDPATFYLLENRQQHGWDIYLPGHGLMLTKITYTYNKWYNNTVNYSSSSLGINLIEADGKTPTYNERKPTNGYFGKTTDLFPAGAVEYTGISDHALTAITETTDSLIQFSYRATTDLTEVVHDSEHIIGIYAVTGQKMPTTDIALLPKGIYIIRTSNSSYKIQR